MEGCYLMCLSVKPICYYSCHVLISTLQKESHRLLTMLRAFRVDIREIDTTAPRAWKFSVVRLT